MKLELETNDLRLTLDEHDLYRLEHGREASEATRFGAEEHQELGYGVIVTDQVDRLQAVFKNDTVTVLIPRREAEEWMRAPGEPLTGRIVLGYGQILSLAVASAASTPPITAPALPAPPARPTRARPGKRAPRRPEKVAGAARRGPAARRPAKVKPSTRKGRARKRR